MSEEIKPIIKVEVGDSERTVKSLKKEISDLKDSILNLKKGSTEYNNAVEQLTAAQRDLNEVQALTKRTATALDGSYDALVHTMSQLKKEWRATNDEAKRNELGKQIAEINQELKDLDAELGNYQRNVGNYVSHWEGMPEVTKDFGAAMREMNESIEPTKQKFEAVGKISSGLASGFAVVQGSMALLGVESENLEKTFVKLQAAMAIMQGVKGIGDLVEGIGKAKVAFQGFGDKLKVVTKLFGGGGSGTAAGTLVAGCTAAVAAFALVAAAAIAVAGNLDKLKQKIKGFSEADEAAIAAAKLNTELTKLSAQSASGNITRVKQLADAYNDLGDDLNAKKQFVEQYAGELEDMGIKMTGVNDAENVFKNETDNYINALMARAKANAIAKKAEEDYAKFLEERAVLEEEVATQKAKQNAGTPDKSFWQNLGEAIIIGSNSELAAPIEANTNLLEDWTEDIAAENVRKAEQAVVDATKKADAALEKAFNEAKALNEQADKYLKGGNKPTGGGGSNQKTKTPEEALAEAYEKAQAELAKSIDNIEFEDIDIPDVEPIKLKEEKGGINAQYAKGNIDYYEKVLQRELALNDISDKSDEEKYERKNQLLIANEEKKLAILKEYQQKAIEEGDWQSQLALQQDIADQEVAIQVEKNRQIIESDEKRKEKQNQIIGDVSAALSAAGQLTQGIMEIVQAKAEEDGEISEQEAKRIKGLQYATASINMLQGAISAYAAAQTIPPPLGPILGGVNAAAVIAMGTANLMKIKNTDITGAASSGAQAAVTPNSNVFGTDVPFSYTKQVTGASEIDALNQDTRVYILESDIQESNNRVQVRENESSF